MMSLNILQKKILDATLEFLFSECKELSLIDGLHVLKTTLGYHLPEPIQTKLQELNMFELVMQIRNIFSHPCPQNRSTGSMVNEEINEDGLLEQFVYYYLSGELYREKQGLLSLTSKNDSTSNNVTKTDVVNYIRHSIYKKIQQYKQKLHLTDFYYYHPEDCGAQSNREKHVESRHHLKYHDIDVTITVNSALTNRIDTMWMPGLENLTKISVMVCNSERSEQIQLELSRHNPTVYNKRSRSGTGYIDTPIQMHRGLIDGEMIGSIHFGTFGQDPACSHFFDIINQYVFDSLLPHSIMNTFREICGQDLQTCPEGIDLDEHWPGTLIAVANI